MAEFGQILLLVLTVAWISQEVPKPNAHTPTAAADTVQTVDLSALRASSDDSLACIP